MPKIIGIVLSRDDYIIRCRELRHLSANNGLLDEYGTIPPVDQSFGTHSVISTNDGIIHEILLREDADALNVTLIHELWHVAEFLTDIKSGSITNYLDEEKISKLFHRDK
jgi:hypothetical protein